MSGNFEMVGLPVDLGRKNSYLNKDQTKLWFFSKPAFEIL